jgi:hypothetical protein
MQLVAASDALDGEDVGAVMADRQRQARIDPPPVDQNGTGAALATVTSLFGSSQVQTLAQKIQQRDARVFEFDVPPHTVDGEADGEIHAGAPINATVKLPSRRRAIARHVRVGCLSTYTEASSVYQDKDCRSMIGKKRNWFSEKIMLKQRDEIKIRFNLTRS